MSCRNGGGTPRNCAVVEGIRQGCATLFLTIMANTFCSKRCRDALLGAITEQDWVIDYEVEDSLSGSAQLRIWIPCDDGTSIVIAIEVESQDAD